jgi:hypothetical protein
MRRGLTLRMRGIQLCHVSVLTMGGSIIAVKWTLKNQNRMNIDLLIQMKKIGVLSKYLLNRGNVTAVELKVKRKNLMVTNITKLFLDRSPTSKLRKVV